MTHPWYTCVTDVSASVAVAGLALTMSQNLCYITTSWCSYLSPCKEQAVLGRREMPMLFSCCYWLGCKLLVPKRSGGVQPWCDCFLLLRDIPRKLLFLWRLDRKEGIGSWGGILWTWASQGAWLRWDSKSGFVWTPHLNWLLQQLKRNCIFWLCCWIWKGFFHSFCYVLRVVAVPRSNLNRKHKAAASFLSQAPFILHSSLPSRCCFPFFYFFATRLKLTALWCRGRNCISKQST